MLRPIVGLGTRTPTRPIWWANPPIPPSEANYTIPGGATEVTTSAAFATNFTGGTAKDIYVRNGAYSQTGPLTAGAGHRIWCETVDGVTFDHGVLMRDRTAWEWHGGTFDITDPAKIASDGGGTPKTAAIIQWVSGSNTNRNAKVSDVKIDIHHNGMYGVGLLQPGGGSIERIRAKNCTHEGVYAFNNASSTAAGWLTTTIAIDKLHDIYVEGIYSTPRGAQDGKDEYGIIVGHPVTNGVRRIRGRNLGWAGMMTIGRVADTVFRDLNFDVIYGTIPVGSPTSTDDGYLTGQGIYIERTTRRCVFERFVLGSDMFRGFANEWDENQNYRLTSTYTIGDTEMFCDYGRFDAQVVGPGTLYIGDSDSPVAVSYTSYDAPTKKFTGCSGGSGGPYAAGTFVSTWPGGRHANTDTIIRQGWVHAFSTRSGGRSRKGVTFDQGTVRPILRDVTLRGALDVSGPPSGADGYGILDATGVPHATSAASSEAKILYVDSSNRAAGSEPIKYG